MNTKFDGLFDTVRIDNGTWDSNYLNRLLDSLDLDVDDFLDTVVDPIEYPDITEENADDLYLERCGM